MVVRHVFLSDNHLCPLFGVKKLEALLYALFSLNQKRPITVFLQCGEDFYGFFWRQISIGFAIDHHHRSDAADPQTAYQFQ